MMYLVLPSLAEAEARSNQQALANGCAPSDETQYWWPVLNGPAGAGALVIADTGDYGAAGLIAVEQAKIQSAAQMTAAGWTL